MTGSQVESIRDLRDLLKDYISRQDVLQQIVEKVDSRGYNVRTLLEMSDDDLHLLRSKLFPEGSYEGPQMGLYEGAQVGFKTAIESRKKRMHPDSTAGSSSGPPYAMDENLLKELREFLVEAKMERQSKKSFSISSIKSTEWDTLGRATGFSQTGFDLRYTPKRLSDLPAFGWDDREERTQADRYIPHIKKIRKARKWTIIDAANSYPNLLSGQLSGYTVRGTTDVAIALRAGMTDPRFSLRCIFELKKNDAHQGKHQILVGLVMANILSDQFRPFAVLTDLINDWTLYWMDNLRIYFTKFETRAVAVGVIEDLLGENQVMDDSSGLPFLATVGVGSEQGDSSFAQILNRRMYVPPGTENMQDLVGLIPDDEIVEARREAGLRHLLQALQGGEFGEGSGGFVTLRGSLQGAEFGEGRAPEGLYL